MNASEIGRKRARFLAVASIAAGLGIASNASAANSPIVPAPESREIVIHNNSTSERVYPVIQVGIRKGNPDLWMQAQFDVLPTDTYRQQFPSTLDYRAYFDLPQPGSPGGIPPGKSITIKVPFYTQLKDVTTANLGVDDDQFIDWWNGVRIYLFYGKEDLESALLTNDTNAGAPKPVEPFDKAATPSCTNEDGTACAVSLLTYVIDPLPNIPFQLQEYSFASAEGPPPGGSEPAGSPLKIMREYVNYNVSSLDSVYLPVAVGPLNSHDPKQNTKYLGTEMSVIDFNKGLARFSDKGEDWPFFVPAYFDPGVHAKFPPIYGASCSLAPFGGAPPYLLPSIPGTANVLIESYRGIPSSSGGKIIDPPIPPKLSSLPPGYASFPGYNEDKCVSVGIAPYETPALGDRGQAVVDLWHRCTASSSDMSVTCTDMRTVAKFFEANYTAKCGTSNPPDPVATLFAVYGWVPIKFPLYASPNCQGDSLAGPNRKPSPEYKTAAEAYCRLQYNYLTEKDPADWFNPYTQLIHEALESSAYAFSIDDKAAFRHLIADGIILAIGGTHGLQDTARSPLPTKGTISDFCKTDP